MEITPMENDFTKEAPKGEEENTTALFSTFPQKTAPDIALSEERYEIIETLGQGGMGVVQRVKDRLLGREVALKKLNIESFGEQLLSQKQKMLLWRLQTEAQITSILEHPNIIPLYDLQKGKNQDFYFTMRKIEGETFTKILKNKTALKTSSHEKDILAIFFKICDAIAYAHSRGIIHRDLKPDNIMVGKFGEVYVMDWGIARFVQQNVAEKDLDLTIESFLPKNNSIDFSTIGGLGTPGYMPPEQRENAHQVSFSADIYALGKILKQCFTGLSPMEEFRSILATYQKAPKSIKPGLLEEELAKQIPVEIQAIIQKATQETPSLRYKNVIEMREDLERFLSHQRISAKSYNWWELFQNWLKRNQQKIVLFLFITFLFFLFISYRFWERVQELEQNFQEAYTLSLKNIQESNQFSEEGKQNIEKKIQYLIESLNALNTALQIKPMHLLAEEKKLQVGTNLLNLCYQTQDYQLASYIVHDLQSLHFLTYEQKNALKKQVESEKTKVLRQHQERLQYWIEALKNPTSGIKERAFLEISKMQEDEIFEQLCTLVQEGTEYYLQSTERTTKKDSFYRYIVEALGCLENPNAKDILFTSLVQIGRKVVVLPEKERPVSDVAYMATLVESLAYSRVKNIAKTIYDIRLEMGQNKPFWNQTIISHRILAEIDGFDHFNSMDSDFYKKRGMAKALQGKWEEALEDVLQAAKLNPEDSAVHTQLGTIKLNSNDFQGAIEEFTLAIQYQPTDLNYLNRSAAKQKIKDWVGAIEDSNKAIELNPDNPLGYNHRGNSKTNSGDYEGAKKDFDYAISLSPNNSILYLNRGFLKSKLEDYQGAILDYNLALECNPNYESALMNRGVVKATLNQWDEAIADYDRALEINSQSPEIYNNRGNAKKRKGDLEGAILDYNEAILLDPSSLDAYLNRASLLLSMGVKKKKAENQVFQLFKKNPPPEEFGLAEADLKKILELYPNCASAFNTRAILKKEQGDITGAIADFETCLQLDPNYFFGYISIGRLKLEQKDQEGAEKEFATFLELTQHTKNPDLLKNRHILFENFPKLKEKYKK